MEEELSLETIEKQIQMQYRSLYETLARKLIQQTQLFIEHPPITQRSILQSLEKIITDVERSPEKTIVSKYNLEKYSSMLIELREKMSYQDIAKLLGTSRPTIVRLRQGTLTRKQRPEFLEKIERLYNANFPDNLASDERSE